MPAKPTLVIGASANPDRYSYRAMHLLRHHGHPVLALGQRAGEVAGQQIETRPEALEPGPVHTVTLYVNPALQAQYEAWLLKLRPERVIFNPGTENPALMQTLAQAGIEPVAACTLVMLHTGQY
ncbi:MAG: CoA-binding protein [Bacteroidia bacterium]|nr:CoA-binding protein [Bacteroidia bacterium]